MIDKSTFLDDSNEVHALWFGFYYALFDNEIIPDFIKDQVVSEFHYYLLGRCIGNFAKKVIFGKY